MNIQSSTTYAARLEIDYHEDHDRHLNHEVHNAQNRKLFHKGSEPAAQEEDGSQGADGDHVDIFSHEEECELDTAILGSEARDQLVLSFGQVKWRATGLSQPADKVDDKADRL